MNKDYMRIVKSEMERIANHLKKSKSEMERNFYQNRYDVQLLCFAQALGIKPEELETKLQEVA